MGYSSSVIARNPLQIAEVLRNLLAGKRKTIPKNFDAYIPFFKGTIEQGSNDKQFIFKGCLKKGKVAKKYGTIIIDELPPRYQRETYIEFLEKLAEKGIVNNWTDKCQKNNFYFEIKVPKEIYNKSENELEDLFGLIQKQSENLTFLYYTKDKKEILEFDSITEYLIAWIKERVKIYDARKQFILNDLKHKIMIAENRARFIQMIVDRKLIIEKKKKKVLESELENLKFDKIDDKYDYLLSMSLWNLTQEKINELNEVVKKLKKQYEETEKKEPKQFWLDDLELLIPYLKKELETKTKS